MNTCSTMDTLDLTLEPTKVTEPRPIGELLPEVLARYGISAAATPKGSNLNTARRRATAGRIQSNADPASRVRLRQPSADRFSAAS